MTAPLRIHFGSKPGFAFNVRYAPTAAVTTEDGVTSISAWSSVGVRSIVKNHWQDNAGVWRDSIYFYELGASDTENRISCDEFYVAGPFSIVRHEKDANRAQTAWRDFTPA
jgi:hypothetical protein